MTKRPSCFACFRIASLKNSMSRLSVRKHPRATQSRLSGSFNWMRRYCEDWLEGGRSDTNWDKNGLNRSTNLSQSEVMRSLLG